MGQTATDHRSKHIEKIALESVAMSLKTLLLVVVVAISLHTATSSPTISFEAIGKEKDNVVKSLVGLKGAIISPFAGIAKAKLGLVGGLAGAKLGLAKGLLRPVAGLKRAKLGFVRGMINKKIVHLDF